jgi:hypothetical protein
MSEMGSHDPFGYLKHKLWPKEGLGVKLPIWLPITKSQESPSLSYVQVACHIFLESYQRGLKLCFRPHLNQRSKNKVMGLQSPWNPNFGKFRNSPLGVLGQNDICMLVPWPGIKYIIRGKVVASPQVRLMVNLVSLCLLVARPCTKNAPTLH